MSYVREIDVFSRNAAGPRRLNAEINERCKGNYNMDLSHIGAYLDKYAELSAGLPHKIDTPWGQTYERYGGEGHYAGRKGVHPLDFTVRGGRVIAFTAAARDYVTVLAREGYEGFTCLKSWQNSPVSPAEFRVRRLGTEMVAMRDGVRLATEIWTPDTDEKVPVILIRTPYGRLAKANDYYRFVMRGYAVCVQDVRGQGDSEGEYIPKYYETEDGDDSLNYVAGRSFSNGAVGMFGASYLGCAQWSAAASGNPRLKAIVSIVTSGDPFTDLPRKGGAFASGVMAWAFSVKGRRHDKGNMERRDWEEIMKLRPIKDIPELVFGEKIPFWTEWCSRERKDEFWNRCSWFAGREKISVPALIVSGWYDDNGMATTQALEVVSAYEPGDRKIILGPWIHQANGNREIHGVPFGNNALRYDLDLYYQLWFDKKLKGLKNGVDEGPRVEYYEVGNNRWRCCDNWPPENAFPKPLYLSSRGDAKSSEGNGVLSFEPFAAESSDSFIFDPDSPAPHLIDMAENEICVPENYSGMEKRQDVLIYTSPPLEESFSIAGDVTVEFFASSSAKDTDWVVRITDVDGEGNSIRLCDGLLRAKFRNGFDTIELLEPHKIERYGIRTSKIAARFRKGHRIRLQITSGAGNYIFPNPNTGGDFFADTTSQTAEQRIYHGGKYVSKVILPVIKE